MFEQQLVNALSLGCVYAQFALGFTLIFGVQISVLEVAIIVLLLRPQGMFGKVLERKA